MYKIKNKSLIENTILLASIKKSDIHGNGLFANVDIDVGTVLCILDGQYISNKDLQKLDVNLISEELNYIPEQDKWLIRGFLTDYSAINHSKKPNLIIMNEPLRVVALRNIKKDEELLLDYNKEKYPDDFIEKYNIDTKYLT